MTARAARRQTPRRAQKASAPPTTAPARTNIVLDWATIEHDFAEIRAAMNVLYPDIATTDLDRFEDFLHDALAPKLGPAPLPLLRSPSLFPAIVEPLCGVDVARVASLAVAAFGPDTPDRTLALLPLATTTSDDVVSAHPQPRILLPDDWTPRTMTLRSGEVRVLSRYQENVLYWVEHFTGHAVVRAVAGSGKTTTLLFVAMILKGTGRSAAYYAFNKEIANDVGPKLEGTGVGVSTINALGHRALSRAWNARPNVDAHKYDEICDRAAQHILPPGLSADPKTIRGTSRIIGKLVDFARRTLTDPTNTAALEEMCADYDIDLPEGGPEQDEQGNPLILNIENNRLRAGILGSLAGILDEGQRLAVGAAHLIDFTDQLWLPYVLGITPDQTDFVLVDEAQDLNRAQLELVLKACKPGGRMLFVGDDRQAIYRFAGADARSFWNIAERTNAVVLPLSVCYRCPTAVISLAQQLVPELEGWEQAPQGTIRTIKEANLHNEVQQGDLILCRLTAPLVGRCMELIARGIPARVRGKDIGAQITAVVTATAKLPGYAWAHFGDDLTTYANIQRMKIGARRDAEEQIEKLMDKVEAVRACYESSSFASATDADSFCLLIDGLFSTDNWRPPITLSTVHRAKGLEYPRVLILRPDKLPLVWQNQKEADYEQEQNLRYVALTRAQDTLIFVEEDKPANRDHARQHDDDDD